MSGADARHKLIDFNSDIGESFGTYKLGFDEEVIDCISSANVACGFHAGDPVWMEHTVELARAHGGTVRVTESPLGGARFEVVLGVLTPVEAVEGG